MLPPWISCQRCEYDLNWKENDDRRMDFLKLVLKLCIVALPQLRASGITAPYIFIYDQGGRMLYEDTLRRNPPSVEYDENLEISMVCSVYQFRADSKKQELVETIAYYPNGKIASEKYSGFWHDASVGMSDGRFFYFYKDTLLVQLSSANERSDSTKVIFTYSEKGLCIREDHYRYSLLLKADVNNRGRHNRDDYERTWSLESVIHFFYDSLGQRLEYYAPQVHWDSQNRYTWRYDSLGRIIQKSSYNHKALIWIEDFTYTSKGYEFSRTWFDKDAKPKHINSDPFYATIYTFIFVLDTNGREIERITRNQKGELIGRLVTEYNDQGYVCKTVAYDQKNMPEMTHVYVYEKR